MEKEDIIWLHALRCIATFGIIIIHITLEIFGSNAMLNNNWWIANIYNGFVRFSVPVFFMISGALLFSKKEKLHIFLKTRFLKIIPPFIFWSLFYILINYNYTASASSMSSLLSEIIKKLLFGSEFHLWFVYTLVGLYLVVPILGVWLRSASKGELLFFLAVWLIIIILSIPKVSLFSPEIDLRFFSGYLGFMVLGYYLKTYDFSFLKNIYLLFAILVGALITIIGTYVLSEKNGEFVDFFYTYLSLNVILVSIGVFLLVKRITFKNSRIISYIKYLSKASYSVYLAHIFVLFIFNYLGLTFKIINPLYGIPILSLFCFIITAIAINTLKKYKIFRLIL